MHLERLRFDLRAVLGSTELCMLRIRGAETISRVLEHNGHATKPGAKGLADDMFLRERLLPLTCHPRDNLFLLRQAMIHLLSLMHGLTECPCFFCSGRAELRKMADSLALGCWTCSSHLSM